MQVEIPADIEQIAKQAVMMGAYDSVADYIAAMVRENGLPKHAPVEPVSPASADEWINELKAIATSHAATGYPVDDSRESIYPDRG